ncbi:cupin domain-containing protein [Aspergillus clavatus NRRL 1]|uniref:Cupin domain protein n=1 Tax=Aspergillus clavatus (strain ATCC 1007 / CBS 513.65 / DSM 816 / NCTC 3887 / NRRL 1 / QM 1276 / 107) TaxID=344612 RepID=A1CFT0_ASPCL|nr:cupin domain protein [Aspergillus clavatus NRRL 1]EAW11729.1 cupin domain protein [Aspergillus clavatus NRRL 1]
MSSNPGQVSPLTGVTRYITTHNPEGKAVIHSETPLNWASFQGGALGMGVVYTTSEFPANLNDETDIKRHEDLAKSNTLGLVNPNGTVCRVVDFAPGGPPFMHRTQSLDYGIVAQGTIEMLLDSGEKRVLRAGDIAVQRGTMHAWRNPSETEWTRMVFVLQECQEVKIGDAVLGEDLTLHDNHDIKPSRALN